MIVFIAGGTHTGKTLAAQKLLEKYHYPYLSIDHLKMGLIRSGICPLSPESDDGELTAYLWNIVKEIVKTALENRQNLVVEGCYIPFDWKKDFDREALEQIRYVCLIFSEEYIRSRYGDIRKYATSSNGAWTTAIARRKCCLKRTGAICACAGSTGAAASSLTGNTAPAWTSCKQHPRALYFSVSPAG